MKKGINILSVLGITIVFTIVICYILSQNNVADIPYIYFLSFAYRFSMLCGEGNHLLPNKP